MTVETANQYTLLRQLIGEHFNHPELIALCFDLGIPESKLRHETDELLIIDVIKQCYQSGRMTVLITYCRTQRPLPDWPEPELVTWVEEPDAPGSRFHLIQLPPPNPNFTGRDDLLNTIQSSFHNQQASIAITQAIAGLGGVGKTQLALAYAQSQRTAYDLMWWLNAENEPALTESLVTLGRALHLPVDAMDRPAAVAAVLTWITSTPKRWLLIYDNVDSLTPHNLRPYLPGGTGHVLITSRNPHWRGTAHVLNVNVFTPEEALDFLQVRSGGLSSQERAEARTTNGASEALAEALGYLPLALEQAAAYMETRGKTAADYLALFRQRRQELWAKAAAPDAYHATITTTWDIGFSHARQTRGAADLLNLCCFFAPDEIPLALIQEQAAVLPEALAAVLGDELALDDAVTALTRFSLMTKQDGLLAMHRLVQTVARDQMGEERAREWAEAAVDWLNAIWPFDSQDMTTWGNCPSLLPHLVATLEISESYQIETTNIASLNGKVDFYLDFFGDKQGALPYSKRALAIREKALGPEHPATATSLNNLGSLLKAMGNLGEARPFHERALAITEKALGPEHPDTGISAGNLAGILEATGNLKEALPLRQRALEIHEKSLGESHPITATSLNNLGYLLYAMGNLGEAQPLYERALAIKEKALGPEHPATATSLNNLGNLLQAMGNLGEARPFYERALAINEKALGPEHPDTAQSLNNLAILSYYEGDKLDAAHLMRRALTIREAALGPDHPNSQNSRRSLAVIESELKT